MCINILYTYFLCFLYIIDSYIYDTEYFVELRAICLRILLIESNERLLRNR